MSFSPDEPAPQIFAEQTFLQGLVLNAVGYGAQAILYAICMHLLWNRKKSGGRRMDYFLAIFATVIVILGTLNLASDAAFAQAAFITNRNYPGGPAQYENDFFYVPIDTLGNVSFMLSNWACDGLMVSVLHILFVFVTSDAHAALAVLADLPVLLLSSLGYSSVTSSSLPCIME